jgi:hypothetical protein
MLTHTRTIVSIPLAVFFFSNMSSSSAAPAPARPADGGVFDPTDVGIDYSRHRNKLRKIGPSKREQQLKNECGMLRADREGHELREAEKEALARTYTPYLDRDAWLELLMD